MGKIEASVHRRIWVDKLFKVLIIVLSFSSIVPMFLILFLITKNGISVVNWEFLSQLPQTGRGNRRRHFERDFWYVMVDSSLLYFLRAPGDRRGDFPVRIQGRKGGLFNQLVD